MSRSTKINRIGFALVSAITLALLSVFVEREVPIWLNMAIWTTGPY